LNRFPSHEGQNILTRQPWRVAIVTTHPIQYQTPWYRALSARPEVDLEVLFCHRQSGEEQAAAGFGVAFDWDVPLLDGYRSVFFPNVARRPGIHRFSGLDTPRLAAKIRAREYDAVLVNGWSYKSAWQAILACWWAHVPVLVRGDSHLHTPRGIAKSLAKRVLYRLFIPRFDACLAVGRRSADYFRQYGAHERNLFCVPHVVDVERFSSQAHLLEPTRCALRREWNLPRNAAVYLFAGKLLDMKRPLDFVRALGQASASGADVAGVVVGDGPLRSACEHLARHEGTTVAFKGFLNQTQMPAAYAIADALVLPSNENETWGLVVNEAMSCGRACFVSDDVGCGPDLVRSGETGETFQCGNVRTLSKLLERYAHDRGHLARMGQCAATRAASFRPAAAAEATVGALAAQFD
jgi:glycosyltransferase involved in cell wall biosynthesis